MSNPSGPDQPDDVADEAKQPAEQSADDTAAGAVPESGHEAGEAVTEAIQPAGSEHEPATEIMEPAPTEANETAEEPERRFTAPSNFDASATQRIDTPAELETEVFAPAQDAQEPPKPVAPQLIPPRGEVPKPPPPTHRSWGWVVAIVLAIAALVAVAVLGTVWLTRSSEPEVSQEEMVRTTIKTFDTAIQRGDLATLRSITCGATRDSYVGYDDRSWAQIHARVAAAKQYPVVASIDQVVINGDHAEANVTTFMADATQIRSTRSFDLEFRDGQWKICQAPAA